MILYFSATGNSKFVAQVISESTGYQMVDIGERIKKDVTEELYSQEPYILVCPIYAWRIPRIVEEYLKRIKLSGNKKIYVIVTTCGSSGNASKYARKFVESKYMKYMGLETFFMPGSYIAFMENPSKEQMEKLSAEAIPKSKKIADLVRRELPLNQENISGLGKFMSKVANPFFYKNIIGKEGFYTTKDCIGCGKCKKVCSLNNIEMKNGKPVWGKDCTHCMACIHRCPKRAIEFKNKTQHKNRYYNNGYIK